ncbi:MAG: OmpA family protein [Flavobacteriales bacterium]|nr:OmpA family protein [Flavobacteriales bacterium]
MKKRKGKSAIHCVLQILSIGAVICLTTLNLAASEKIKTKDVLFDYDKSEIVLTEKEELDKLVSLFNSKNYKSINLKGHTDGDGSFDYNNHLSARRVNAVRNYLLKKGIAKDRIVIENLGEYKPIASNLNDDGKRINRRVEIELLKEGGIIDAFQVEYSDYLIDPNRDTILKMGTEGTQLHIRAYSFVDDNKVKVTEPVNLKFREYRNSADVAFSQIPMTFHENEREHNFNSSGMFEIRGEVNGEPINIAEGKSIIVDYKLAKKNPNTDFFKMDDVNKNWVRIADIPEMNLVEEEISFNEIMDLELEVWEKKKVRGKVEWKKKQGRDNGDRVEATLLGGQDKGHQYPDIVSGLNVSSFGVYNCDQIYRIKQKIKIRAKYVDGNGNPIQSLGILSMIDLDYNGAFSFDPNNFVCAAEGDNVLLLTTKKNKLYLFDRYGFEKNGINESGEYTFQMRDVTDEIKSTKDLALYLGLDI